MRGLESFLGRRALFGSVSNSRVTYIVKIGLIFSFLPIAATTTACEIPIDIIRADISKIEGDIDSSGKSESHVYRVDAYASKDSIRQLINFQLYSHIHILDCRTRQVKHAVFPFILGAPADNFEQMEIAIDSSADQVVILSGNFNAEEDFRRQAPCVTLNGGGYWFGRIQSQIVRATIIATPSVSAQR